MVRRTAILIDALPETRDPDTTKVVRDLLMFVLARQCGMLDLPSVDVEVLRGPAHDSAVAINDCAPRQVSRAQFHAADFVGYLYRTASGELRLAVTKDRHGLQTDFALAGM